MEEKPSIKVEKSPDFKRCHATGMWGSINQHNELVFHITEDIIEMPEKIELEINEKDGQTIITEKPVNIIPNIKRIDHIEVTMPIDVLQSVIQWLQQKLEQYNNMNQPSQKI